MRLLVIDGTNVVMRCAFGGDIAPEQAVPTATGILRRAIAQYQATHMVIALDSPSGAPSWRKLNYDAYKANRTRDTTPWIVAAMQAWMDEQRWCVFALNGFEADDIIATIAMRAMNVVLNPPTVLPLSGDSDILSLAQYGLEIIKPVNGGLFQSVRSADVRKRYGVAPDQLVDFKAMVGETGDNVPGVPGIGPGRAKVLLEKYSTLDGIIEAGKAAKCKHSVRVVEHEATARLAKSLIELVTDAPVPPVKPSECRV